MREFLIPDLVRENSWRKLEFALDFLQGKEIFSLHRQKLDWRLFLDNKELVVGFAVIRRIASSQNSFYQGMMHAGFFLSIGGEVKKPFCFSIFLN